MLCEEKLGGVVSKLKGSNEIGNKIDEESDKEGYESIKYESNS